MPISVSVVIPAYNASAFITETLDSVANQTRQADEVIVVDDGSTDDTYQTVVDWLSARPHFPGKIIRQKNQGASAARNTAIENATKDYIAFLDSDDLWAPTMLSTLVSGISLCPDCVVVFADQGAFSDEGVIYDSFLIDKPLLHLPAIAMGSDFKVLENPVWGSLIYGSFISMSTSLINRQSALKTSGFDVRFKTSEDRHFWLRLTRLGKVGYFNKVLAKIRMRPGSLTCSDNLNLAANAYFVVKDLWDNRENYHLSQEELNETEKALTDCEISWLYYSARHSFIKYMANVLFLAKQGKIKYLFNVKNFLASLLPGTLLDA
jgi:glycosyltransferase involved in cell wall biosynthesis